MLMHQLQKLQQRIGQMQQLEQQLIALKQRCDEQRTVKQCGIIEPLKTAKDDREWGHQEPLRYCLWFTKPSRAHFICLPKNVRRCSTATSITANQT